jgi:hypothetical protein
MCKANQGWTNKVVLFGKKVGTSNYQEIISSQMPSDLNNYEFCLVEKQKK